MQIEHCPFCLLRGVESECYVTSHEEIPQDNFFVVCKKCGYMSPISQVSEDDACKHHNAVSLAVRESLWHKFDENDESTYPPKIDFTPIIVTLKDDTIAFDNWISFVPDGGGIAYGFEHDSISLDDVKAWRIPTPYKEHE